MEKKQRNQIRCAEATEISMNAIQSVVNPVRILYFVFERRE